MTTVSPLFAQPNQTRQAARCFAACAPLCAVYLPPFPRKALPMSTFELLEPLPGSDRWRIKLNELPGAGKRLWLVFSTDVGSRVEIPVEAIAAEVEVTNGRDANGITVRLVTDEALARDRIESAAYFSRLDELKREGERLRAAAASAACNTGQTLN